MKADASCDTEHASFRRLRLLVQTQCHPSVCGGPLLWIGTAITAEYLTGSLFRLKHGFLVTWNEKVPQLAQRRPHNIACTPTQAVHSQLETKQIRMHRLISSHTTAVRT